MEGIVVVVKDGRVWRNIEFDDLYLSFESRKLAFNVSLLNRDRFDVGLAVSAKTIS